MAQVATSKTLYDCIKHLLHREHTAAFTWHRHHGLGAGHGLEGELAAEAQGTVAQERGCDYGPEKQQPN